MKIETQICDFQLHFDEDNYFDLKNALLFFESQKVPKFSFNFLTQDQDHVVAIFYDGNQYLLEITKIDRVPPVVWRDFNSIDSLLANFHEWHEKQKTHGVNQ